MSSASPTINLAVIYSEPGVSLKTEVTELPIPDPGEGEVLVRLSYSGVCHTDIGFCMNLFPNIPPTPRGQIGGHEGIGTVVALGPGINSPSVGSQVGIKFAADACLTCERCLEGGDSSCKESKISGYFTPGTFQQYCIATSRYLTPIPPGLDPAATAPLMCGGITVYTALKRAGLCPGQWVVVCGGGGGLGHFAIQYARAMGGKVIAIDAGSKRELCESLGADEFVDFTAFQSDTDMKNEIIKLTNGGARIVLQCTSSSKAYSQSMSWLGFRGTLACLGIPEREGSLVPSVAAMVSNELRIIATKTGNRMDIKECLELAAQSRVKTQYTLRKMEDLTAAFEELETHKVSGRVVLDLR